jgi:hypothetical protein
VHARLLMNHGISARATSKLHDTGSMFDQLREASVAVSVGPCQGMPKGNWRDGWGAQIQG